MLKGPAAGLKDILSPTPRLGTKHLFDGFVSLGASAELRPPMTQWNGCRAFLNGRRAFLNASYSSSKGNSAGVQNKIRKKGERGKERLTGFALGARPGVLVDRLEDVRLCPLPEPILGAIRRRKVARLRHVVAFLNRTVVSVRGWG